MFMAKHFYIFFQLTFADLKKMNNVKNQKENLIQTLFLPKLPSINEVLRSRNIMQCIS